MLRVHRNQLAGFRRALDQLAAGDEGLLVRQRQQMAGFQRSQGRHQADRTGNAIEYDVGIRPGGDPRRRVVAGKEFGLVTAEACVRSRCLDRRRQVLPRTVGNPYGFCPGVYGLPGNQFQIAAAGRQGSHFETLRGAVDHVDALGSDGTGGPQQHYFPWSAGCLWVAKKIHVFQYPAPDPDRTHPDTGSARCEGIAPGAGTAQESAAILRN
jgi:hypothetical protein